MATTLQQLGNGVEVVQLPDGSWLITQAGDATSATVWEWAPDWTAAEGFDSWLALRNNTHLVGGGIR